MVGLGEAFGEGEPDSAEDDGADGLDEQVGEHGCPFSFLELLDEVEREGGEGGVAAEETDAKEESEGVVFCPDTGDDSEGEAAREVDDQGGEREFGAVEGEVDEVAEDAAGACSYAHEPDFFPHV